MIRAWLPGERPSRAVGRLIVLLAAVLAAGCGGAPDRDRQRSEARHLILITVDTWRGDHFLGERGGVPLTPNLEDFAAGCVRFSNAYSVSNSTSPGVAGILTGLLPRRSGVIVNDHALAAQLPSITTVLGDLGFVCAAFVANPVLAPGFGFDNAFDHYEEVRRTPPQRKARAEEVNRRVMEWLAEAPLDERIFLWAHYMEPHGPYQPPDEYRAMFSLDRFEAPRDIPLLPKGRNGGLGGIPRYQQAGLSPVPTDGRDYLLRYAAEVRYLDHELGALLAELRARGVLDRSVLVITSDHGEAMADDHGYYFSHDNGLTEDQIRVPLLLSFPGCDGGRVVAEPVSTADILPTVLDLLGAPPLAETDGGHLLADGPRLVASQIHSEESVRQGRWKIRRLRPERTWTLVDLVSDPGETTDLSAAAGPSSEELRQRLAEIRARPALAASVDRRELDEEQRRALEALGYVAGDRPAQ